MMDDPSSLRLLWRASLRWHGAEQKRPRGEREEASIEFD